MSTTSTKYSTEPEVVLQVSYATRPSLRALCAELALKARQLKPFDPDTPLVLHTNLALNAIRDRWRGDRGVAWHLANPSAANVSYAVLGALIDTKLLKAGQVVQSTASKMFHNEVANVLIVTINSIDSNSKFETQTFKHKMLDWYLEQCAIKNIPANKVTYEALFKNLNAKIKKSKAADNSFDFSKQVPSFLDQK